LDFCWSQGVEHAFLLIIQKCILKIAVKRSRMFPSDQLFLDYNVLDLRQLSVKHLLVYIFLNYSNIFTQPLNTYATRSNVNIGIFTPRMTRTFSTTNPFYNAHTLYKNLPNDLRGFDNFTLPAYKRKVVNWLKEIGRRGTQTILTSLYRWKIKQYKFIHYIFFLRLKISSKFIHVRLAIYALTWYCRLILVIIWRIPKVKVLKQIPDSILLIFA